MKNAASVKAGLKNIAQAEGKTLQEMLTAYRLERTIYRISVSEYAKNFTLKGGIFLYALSDRNYAGVTTDIDLLAQNISNQAEEIENIFRNIFSMKTDDPLYDDLNSLKVRPITEFKKYHGVNVSIMAYLDRTRISESMNISQQSSQGQDLAGLFNSICRY